jgi:hypothetical protein
LPDAFGRLGRLDTIKILNIPGNMEKEEQNIEEESPPEIEDIDPEQLERQETAAYFWKAILLLLIMIVIVSIVIRKG